MNKHDLLQPIVKDRLEQNFTGEATWLPTQPLSEDCLYLNIWIPEEIFQKPEEEELVSVLFWIHGGGYY
jgi:carboxylesterase type B